jgi:hypothetical protein
MSWSNWFKDSGGSVSEKTVSRSNGETTTHYLRDTGGSKADHQHIAVHRDSSGHTTSANAVPNKSKR